MHKSSSIIMAVAALSLLGAGCQWGTAPGEPAESQPSSFTSAMWAEANGIIVLDQKPGSTVTVSSVLIENDGWVVIHADADGKPGPGIGETYLKAGEYGQIPVDVREATVDGKTYYVMLHRDDGERTFDISKDAAVRSAVLDGVIMATFIADANATEDLPFVSP